MNKMIVLFYCLFCFISIQVSAQQSIEVYQCSGSGHLNGYPATIKVTCTTYIYGETLAGNADYSKASGTIKTNYGDSQIFYEGYRSLPPYKGVMKTPVGDWSIEVLDDISGRFFEITEGGYSLKAKDEIGKFTISWRRIK